MKSIKILYQGKGYYINESIFKRNSKNIVLFENDSLSKPAKDSEGNDIILNPQLIKEYIGGGAGGAGYSVYGGSWGRNYSGRGAGFGGSSNLGGPNLMYTYSVVPLNQTLQQQGTPQGDERYIHVGSEITGKVLGKDEEVKGKIISIKNDEDGNILYYLVQNEETAEKQQIDPTSVELITHEERPDYYMRDMINNVGESFYPSFNDYLNKD